MEVVVLILKAIMFFIIAVMTIYAMRHFLFTFNRMMGDQKLYYQDIIDDDLPRVTVLVPMHNEEAVARDVLTVLMESDYPMDKLEIIPINDHSEDKTEDIVNEVAALHPDTIHPLHRHKGMRGKPAALNDAMAEATGQVILVFDADYLPGKGLVRDLAVCFKDPEVGAVMGRVIPVNSPKNMLTRLLDMERAGGYQVDQQARYNLGLVPQYGGTVGGFRRIVAQQLGGFDPAVLTEDTELTFKLFVSGWKVVYANSMECYEESPEEWDVRARQIKRWATGHTQTMIRFFGEMVRSKQLNWKEKVDGALLLWIYLIPMLVVLGVFDGLALFFLGRMTLVEGIAFFVFVVAYNSFGNFAPFYEIGAGSLLDGSKDRMKLLPFFLFNFAFNTWVISLGSARGIFSKATGRCVQWQKTARYRTKVDQVKDVDEETASPNAPKTDQPTVPEGKS